MDPRNEWVHVTIFDNAINKNENLRSVSLDIWIFI